MAQRLDSFFLMGIFDPKPEPEDLNDPDLYLDLEFVV